MKRFSRNYLFVILVFIGIVFFSTLPVQEHKSFHSSSELAYFNGHLFADPVDSTVLFPTVSHCDGCHGSDLQMNAMVDSDGNDINVVDNWQATMMANSAKDPFWRAKVSHEILVNPTHATDLETKCTSCHAPNGHYTAILRGAAHYSIAEMLQDTVAMEGVSCSTCHTMSNENLGKVFSGEINFDTSRVMFGPYDFPFVQPMENFVGFEPIYSEHVNDAGLCASCHTLLTKSVDLDGNYTGEQFVEQATYHEWLNSVYGAEKGIEKASCQKCHMPRIMDTVVISSNYSFLQGRSPFALHELVGGNTTMLKLMKENKEALNISATDEQFDNTIANTFTLLQEQSVDFNLEITGQDVDSAYFSIDIINKAGHKFPSGYPARRAYVEFVATTMDGGDTLFQSGVMEEDYEVKGQTEDTEPHFDRINREDQVQIYELVLGDVNGDFTTVLERSHQALKDNRLPPLGFTTTHSAYDTTKIYGAALDDSNFNKVNGVQGSGADRIKYHFAINGYEGLIKVDAKMYYQSLPPKWMAPMFKETTPEIEVFRSMYESADLSPVLVASSSMDSIFVSPVSIVDNVSEKLLNIFPNPTTDGNLKIGKDLDLNINELSILNAKGILIANITKNIKDTVTLPNESGLYILVFKTNKGTLVRKVIKVRNP